MNMVAQLTNVVNALHLQVQQLRSTEVQSFERKERQKTKNEVFAQVEELLSSASQRITI